MRKVLFITYYFPPGGGPGVQRGLKFIKYLPEFGWLPTVLTVKPEYASWPALDPGLCDEVDPDIRVVRTRSWDPYSAYAAFTGRSRSEAIGVRFLGTEKARSGERIARWIRANFFIPDARVGWVRYGKRALESVFREQTFDAVFSTGPPHSSHLIGLDAHLRGGLPWIVDIRDTWPDPSYARQLPTGAWARTRDAALRKKVFSSANAITGVGQGVVEESSRWSDTPVHVIMNGFDEDDFLSADPVRRDQFVILYAGTMSEDQNPDDLWHVVARRTSEGDWQRLRVHLVGKVDPAVSHAVARVGLDHRVESFDYVPHTDAVRHMCGSAMNLLPINRVRNARGILTGKLFEYLASRRPILCLGPCDSEAADIIRECEAGETVEYGDLEGLDSIVDRHYCAWERDEAESGGTPEAIAQFSRRSQTEKLAVLLEEITS